MAVIILTDNSFLLNHLFDSQVLFPFEKSARVHGFGHASWRLFAYIPGKFVQKETPDFNVIGDAQENESVSGIKPVHALTPHRLGFPSPVRVGVVVALNTEDLKPSPKQEKTSCVLWYIVILKYSAVLD